MSHTCPAQSSDSARTIIDHCRASLVLVLLFLVLPSCLRAAPALQLPCDSRAVAKALIDGKLQKALKLSIECEERNRLNIDANFAQQNLKGAYLVSAQILTAQGKFDMARERINKAKALPDSFLIGLDELMNTAEGYVLERSGRTAEAVTFYRSVATPYALVQIGKIYFDMGRTDEAQQIINDSIKVDPSSPAAHAILGEILEGSDTAAARREYKRALALTTQGNSTIVALVYLDVARAKIAIERLH